jgi:hypothetical protein
MLNFKAIWCILLPFGIPILWPFGIFCGHFSRFGMLYQEKSGNPVRMSPHPFRLPLLCQLLHSVRNVCFAIETTLSMAFSKLKHHLQRRFFFLCRYFKQLFRVGKLPTDKRRGRRRKSLF